MRLNKLLIPTLISLAFNANATDGYIAHGYGVKSQATGGVAIALPQDSLVIASNPAGIAWLGDRIDIGATWFRPIRDAEITGSAAPINGNYSGSDTKNFIIPEFGYIKQLTSNFNFGIAAYGNGGMNTDYKDGFPLFGITRAGVDLIQVFVSPTIAWKPTESQSIGVSLNLAYQRFEAKGLQNFANATFSQSPNNVTNNGHDDSYGAGLHFGWLGQINDKISIGAHYQTKTYTTKFDKYNGLFANSGDFDIPASYGLGIAVKATPSLTLAADIQRIEFGDVDSVGNHLSNLFASQLGNQNGAGFGWNNATVFKLGGIYAYNETLTLRAGYNHVDQPIPKDQTLFNVLAPAVITNHVTLGATWKVNDKNELSFSYVHAFENEVNGNNSIPSAFGGGEANLKMYQDSVGVAYSWIF